MLTRTQWLALSADYKERAQIITRHVRARRQHEERHPIEDFLWNYYSLKPAQFEKWHPGFGVKLEEAAEFEDIKGYRVVDGIAEVDPDFVEQRRTSLEWIVQLIEATLERAPKYNCFGLHEWAMVYQLSQDQVRHEQAPLRLSPAEIAQVVEAQELKCTHYDAFRFYVPAARSLNHMVLERTDQLELEQAGCLHANMDLYKWCYKAKPVIDSELMLKCFQLAYDIRTLDMRAAPYDLTQWGLSPVAIETADGRAEYVRMQKEFTERSNALRIELRDKLKRALAFEESRNN